MPKAIYRSIGAKRRTSVPRRRGTATTGLSGAFGSLLAKLSLASGQLAASKPRRR